MNKPLYACDKCGETVPPHNDAVLVEALLRGNWQLVVCQSRHFLPTETCKGSPSRAQYILGQPRDTRGYKYVPEMEAKWRKAYRHVQKLYGPR